MRTYIYICLSDFQNKFSTFPKKTAHHPPWLTCYPCVHQVHLVGGIRDLACSYSFVLFVHHLDWHAVPDIVGEKHFSVADLICCSLQLVYWINHEKVSWDNIIAYADHHTSTDTICHFAGCGNLSVVRNWKKVLFCVCRLDSLRLCTVVCITPVTHHYRWMNHTTCVQRDDWLLLLLRETIFYYSWSRVCCLFTVELEKLFYSLAFCRISEECMVVDEPASGGGWTRKHSWGSGPDQRTQPARVRGQMARMAKLDWWKACDETDEGCSAAGLVTTSQVVAWHVARVLKWRMVAKATHASEV